MIYLGSFGIVALITFFGFYYVYKTKGKEMKKDKKGILLLLGSPFVSFILCTLIYKLTCTFTVSHNNYLPWLSLIICTLTELFAAGTPYATPSQQLQTA